MVLGSYPYYTKVGHRHYDKGSLEYRSHLYTVDATSTASPIEVFPLPITGSVEERLAQINHYTFGTSNPTVGTSVTVQTQHQGNAYDTQRLECYGAYLFPSSPEPRYAQEWATSCMIVPPPALRCSIDMVPDTLHLGTVQAGSTVIAKRQISAQCNMDASIRFLTPVVNTHTTDNQAQVAVGSIYVSDDAIGITLTPPGTLKIKAGRIRQLVLNVPITYQTAGGSAVVVALSWAPH